MLCGAVCRIVEGGGWSWGTLGRRRARCVLRDGPMMAIEPEDSRPALCGLGRSW